MGLARLWRLLPRRSRAAAWRLLDRLGPLPVRLAYGPARGRWLLAPASRLLAYRGGHHERAVLDLVAERLAAGMTFVDGGAFLGYFTLAAAARVGGGGRVWAFEPQPASRSTLERTVERNGLAQVTVVPAALGETPGEARLLDSSNPSMARLAAGGGAGGRRVKVTSLDRWAADTGARPDLVKLDLEGGELAALRGAAGMIARCLPTLVVELHRRSGAADAPRAVVEWLWGAGYELAVLAAEGRRAVAPALGRLEAADPAAGEVVVLHLLATPAGGRIRSTHRQKGGSSVLSPV